MVTSVKGANSSQTVYMVPFAYIWSPSGGLVPFEEGQESRRGPRDQGQRVALFAGIFYLEAYPDESDGFLERELCESPPRHFGGLREAAPSLRLAAEGDALDAAISQRTFHEGGRAPDAGPGRVDRQVPQGTSGSGQVRLLKQADRVLRGHRASRRALRPHRVHGGISLRHAVGCDPGGIQGEVRSRHQAVSAGATEWRLSG